MQEKNIENGFVKYKLVVLDLDGTLLNSNGEISNYNYEVLSQIKKDIKIVMASARGFYRIKPFIEEIGTMDKNNYTIAFNGSLVIDNEENKLIDKKIRPSNLLKLLRIIKENNDYKWLFYTYEKTMDINEIDDVKEFILSTPVYKVVCVANEQDILKLKCQMMQKFSRFFEITSSEAERIELVEKGMTKLDAIKELMRILQINEKELIAIGDGENDIGMIKYAGCGVAMGNAMEIVKNNADVIADTNDCDGVGKVLIKILKQEEISR